MKITLSPQRRDDSITVIKSGDTLTINGEAFDFSAIPEGATLPKDAISSEWFAGDVSRTNGELKISLILPHGADASEAARFPQPITVTSDGPINLPE